MKTATLSVVYITRNAAAHLRQSIGSVAAIADEVLLVDSGSDDATYSIASEFGARIIHHDWQGFGAQRQFAVEAASHDWILMLDADEVLRSEVSFKIRSAIGEGGGGGFYLRWQNYIGSKAIRHGDWAHDWHLRLFDRRYGRYDPNDWVHESWESSIATARLPGISIDHYTVARLQDMLPKLQLYAELNAEKVYARERPVSALAPMNHAMGAFLRSYLLRFGLLDGVEGAAIAWTTALGAFMKYAIAREMRMHDKYPS